MLTTMAVSLLGLLLLSVVSGSATGDVVQILCSASAFVLVLFRLRGEAKPERVSEPPTRRAADGWASSHGAETRSGDMAPAGMRGVR